MAKFFVDAAFDAALGVLDNATTMHVCSAQPANHAGIAAVSLADVAMTAGAGNGDYSALANGDVSGRKITVIAQTAIPVDATGTANHLAGTDGTTLDWVTTCTSQALTSGNTVDTPNFDLEINDPT